MKFVVIGIILYLFTGLLFYFDNLKLQQSGFICPVGTNLKTITTYEKEKICKRNRSEFNLQEVKTAASMMILWLPLLIAKGSSKLF